jgi:hypothetical protein
MKVSSGTAHTLPADLRMALVASPKALAAWNDITPLARNDGFAGPFRSRLRRRERIMCEECARSSSRECVGRVAG